MNIKTQPRRNDQNNRMYTSYYDNIKFLPKTLNPIAISLSIPTDYNYEFKIYKPLSPSPKLEYDYYMGDILFEEFEKIYIMETLSKLNPIDVIEDVGFNGVFICWEKDRNKCHRKIVADWMETVIGIEVPEFVYIDPNVISKNINI